MFQVFAANLQNLHPALKQYLLAGLGSIPTTQSYPSVTTSKQNSAPNYQSLAALASLLSPTLPPVKPQTVSHSPNSILAALTAEAPTNTASSIDASLLNNLAIALQLLLVSNIMNNPSQDTLPESAIQSVPYPLYENKEAIPTLTAAYSQPNQHSHHPGSQAQSKPANHQYISHYEQQMATPTYNPYESSYNSHEINPGYPQIPNANFVGASTFSDSNPFGGTIPPASSASSSRGGFSLMSPYEALSPSSPYSDPILSSPYGSVMTSKKDFQSPYSTIMAADNKDLFSMSDFF